jgi:hypothetical protein
MALTAWRRLVLAGLLLLASSPASALLFTVTANTNWSALSPTPTAADTVMVKNGRTLTVDVTNAVIGAMTLGGPNPNQGNGTLNFSANTSQLTITSASGQAGTLQLGTAPRTGNLNMANGGRLILEGFVSSSVGTFTRSATPTVGTIELTDINTLPAAAAYAAYNNLTVSAGTTSLGQNTTVAGNLSIGTGAALNTSTRTLAVNGTADVDGTLTLTNTTTVSGATTVGGTISITSATGLKTFDDITVDGTWTAAVPAFVTFTGNVVNNGTFTAGTGVYTFASNATQTLSGSAGNTTFANLVLNNTVTAPAAGLALGGTHNLTVSTSMTLSAGKVTTGANVVYIANGANITGVTTGRFVEGNLTKPFAPANLTRTFEVGGNSGSNYSPVSITFAAVSAGGDVTVSTTSGSHPQLAASGLDVTTPAKLNRWYRLTNGGVAFTSYSATFNFVVADSDAAANETGFVAVIWDGTAWDASTVSSAAATSTTITGETRFGDFALGEGAEYNINRGTAARFNAFDTTAPAGAIQGYIRTKTAGTSFNLRIVHLNGTGTALNANATFNGRVELVDASNTGGTYTNNCSSLWTTVIYDSGIVANLFNAANTRNWTFNPAAVLPTNLLNNSWPSVRVRVTRTSGGAEVGCSTDRFAIKPADLLVEGMDATWQTAGTTRTLHNTGSNGGNVHAASTAAASTPRPFTIRVTARNSGATATTNYANTPTLFTGYPACVLPAGCTTGTLSMGTWTTSAGVLTASSHYSEAGTFNLRMEDKTFANVDVVDTGLATRTISQAAPSPREIGRFVPDHFDVTTTTAPGFQTFGVADASCTTPSAGFKRSFTYVGQSFGYVTKPEATIVPKNAGDGTLANYTGVLWKIGTTAGSPTITTAKDCTTNPDVCTFSTTWDAAGGNKSKVIQTYTYVLAPVSTPNWDDALAAPAAASVTSGLIQFADGATIGFKRSTTTPQATFTANISNAISVEDNSEAGISITTGTPATFSNISFDAGNEFRYGRLRLVNAYGSHLVPLPVGIETQYWNGSAFQLNGEDNCTTLVRSNLTLGTYRPNLDPCETAVSQATVSFTQGTGLLYLAAPGAAALTGAGTPTAGSVQLTANLGSAASGNYCPAVGAAEAAATAANRAYLQGAWTGASYNEDPSARGTFGFYGAQPRNFIYFRENY